MSKRNARRLCPTAALAAAACFGLAGGAATPSAAVAQATSLAAGGDAAAAGDNAAPRRVDGWVETRVGPNQRILKTRELVVHPRSAPRPALKHRLVPDVFAAVDGNAATYYLKAMGFLEQTVARKRLFNRHREMAEAEAETGEPGGFSVWLRTPPSRLPMEEVQEYLSLHSFQQPMLREAAKRRHLDFDRDVRDADDLIMYRLPEVQAMRQLARVQSLRCRVAIAEDRVDDALSILGEQFVAASHLGQDDFLVTSLVGIAVGSIAWNDTFHLLEHPNAPNLYWALSSLPQPLVSTRRAMAVEREFLFLQVKALEEVTETPRPPGYWSDFLDRVVTQLGGLASELDLPEDTAAARLALAGFVVAGYPGARDYLIEQEQLSAEQVDRLPTAQTVFLATRRFYEQWRDEVFKHASLPYWQIKDSDPGQGMTAAAQRYGWCTKPAQLLLPAILNVKTAQARSQQNIALLRGVEALRMHAAKHGEFPARLQQLEAPAPIEPFTGKPLDYERVGGAAVLTGAALPRLQYRVVVRLAK